jgi:hypothetical protein
LFAGRPGGRLRVGPKAALFSSLCSGIAVRWLGKYGASLMLRTALLASGLTLAVALTAAWDTFISYEVFRFFEFVL